MCRPRLVLIVVAALLGVRAPSQSFECQPLGPFPPVSSTADCENVTSNNLGVNSGVRDVPLCGMPSSGLQYCYLKCNPGLGNPDIPGGGVFGLPPGAPLPRPIDQLRTSEVLIPVPPGATRLTIHWKFFSGENNLEPVFRDGFDASIVDGTGHRLFQVISVDTTNAPWAPGLCYDPQAGIFETDRVATLGDNIQTTTVVLPPLPVVADLSLVVFNGGDDNVPSCVAVDCVVWDEQELGSTTGVRLLDLMPTTSFKLGATTVLQVDAGPGLAGGVAAVYVQVFDGNIPATFPGYGGALFITLGEPYFILAATNLGTSGRYFGRSLPIVQTLPTFPDLCGLGIVCQGIATDSVGLNPAFSTAVLGWLH